MSVQDQQFEVASMGRLYLKSLELFAHHLEDEDGNEVQLNDMEIDASFFVIFPSGTGFTRTSAKRIA